MNWSLGFFRMWGVLAAAWVSLATYNNHANIFRLEFMKGSWQHNTQIKKMPSETDWSRPYYEIAHAPTAGRFPDTFSAVPPANIGEWDELAKEKRLTIVEFPDGSRLFLNSGLNENDMKVLSRLFWSERWGRYVPAIAAILGGILGLPLLLLAGGIAVRWIIRGFRKRHLAS